MYQLFQFDYPIKELTLEANEFIGIGNLWDQN